MRRFDTGAKDMETDRRDHRARPVQPATNRACVRFGLQEEKRERRARGPHTRR